MCLWNTKEKFGLSMRFLHWSIFLLFIAQFFLVYRREYFSDDMPQKLDYILRHKAIGVVILLFTITMLIARYIGTRPPFPENMPPVQKKVARVMHFCLYASMLLMPISGYLMSTFSGYGISFFGWFQLPKLVAEHKAYAQCCYQFHQMLSYVIIALVSAHVIAAIYHHFVKKDNVLKRMAF